MKNFGEEQNQQLHSRLIAENVLDAPVLLAHPDT
jgi:hypothetical protein